MSTEWKSWVLDLQSALVGALLCIVLLLVWVCQRWMPEHGKLRKTLELNE